jgi:hypothetical protein
MMVHHTITLLLTGAPGEGCGECGKLEEIRELPG